MMKTIKNKKGLRISALKEALPVNMLIMRFIREIEREEPLDNETLKTILVPS